MLQDTRLHQRSEPIPEGWKPLIDFVLPDGQHTTTYKAAEGRGARPADQIYDSIRANCARGLPELSARVSPHARRMVLCCYGPSLRHTWRLAAAEHGDLWTVSGAHHFMLSKGVRPAFHTDVDPRDHKACFVEQPTCDTTHFYAPSRVSPLYLDHLLERNATLYHIKCKQEADVVRACLPDAYLVPSAITAGLCAVQLGLVLGYREFSIYGMDGSASPRDGEKYLGPHPNEKEPFNSLVEIEGRKFATNMLMLLALDDYFAIASDWPMGTFTFHGDGMMQWVEKVARRAHLEVA